MNAGHLELQLILHENKIKFAEKTENYSNSRQIKLSNKITPDV